MVINKNIQAKDASSIVNEINSKIEESIMDATGIGKTPEDVRVWGEKIIKDYIKKQKETLMATKLVAVFRDNYEEFFNKYDSNDIISTEGKTRKQIHEEIKMSLNRFDVELSLVTDKIFEKIKDNPELLK